MNWWLRIGTNLKGTLTMNDIEKAAEEDWKTKLKLVGGMWRDFDSKSLKMSEKDKKAEALRLCKKFLTPDPPYVGRERRKVDGRDYS